ncbi:alpha/beta-hydrolase [Saccharata proteae CBS 121410]|uniref:Alpha/beta-hydrolase n=1 Tax=Saccharata proteae CBS 121410 TaxID=1314787 RepID=A0A6A5YD53_9PEZI|nr:alpha/beta-hydrolase [Saccharata proteae CBS 121410]
MVELSPIFRKAYWGLAATGAAYAAFLLCLTNVTIQRHALYANKIVSAWWVDTNKPESFGFAKNQVTAFNVTTPDFECLSAWHVLPLDVYAENEEDLLSEPSSHDDFSRSKAFRLLTEDPEARVVINFHGNAGNLAQGYRTDTYRSITSLPRTHLIAIDYRGFGGSTGHPTEHGLITDGIALTTYIHTTLNIPPQRILILGQSLGTAVAAATALHFADSVAAASLLPAPSNPAISTEPKTAPPTDFAAVILVAPFTSLPALVMNYRILGLIPILSALRAYPSLQNFFRARIVDTWDTSSRIAALVAATAVGGGASIAATRAADADAGGVGAGDEAATAAARRLRLHILHAKNDVNIPRRHGEALYRVASGALGMTSDGVEQGEARVVQGENDGSGGGGETGSMGWRRRRSDGGGREVLLDVLAWGGHNRVVTFAPVQLAVLRGFDGAGAAS